jgi:hypothetical protein
MSDSKLLPGNNAASSDFVWFNFETTIFEIEHMRFLCENSRQESNDCPAQETAICCCIATIEERILFLTVTMDITVNPNLSFFSLSYTFHQVFNMENLRLEILVWLDPLSIQINPTHCIPIIAAHHTIRIQARD